MKTLLNVGGMSIDSLILNIFIILGVVVAGSLIIYFIWEAVTSLMNKGKKANDKGVPVFDKNAGDGVIADYQLDAQPVVEPIKEEEVVLIDQSKLVDVDEAKAEEEKAEVESAEDQAAREAEERRAQLEARRQELIRRMQAEMEEETEEETVEEAEAEEEVAEVQEETAEIEEVPVAVAVAEEVSEEETEEVAEEQEDKLEEERKALAAEKERYEAMVKQLEEAKQAMILAQAQVQVQEVAPVATETPVFLTVEELKERLAAAEERLKATEKEFKQCKKEYVPLRKVWNTYEKDVKKLRRKEALVVKQKLVLYGVNNYSELDEEKAQKLAEDMDLYDGLKLSVQHCEEIMKKNEERYPLLEKMYNVLKLRNEELKKDIASYKAEIARIEAENASEGSEQETVEQ